LDKKSPAGRGVSNLLVNWISTIKLAILKVFSRASDIDRIRESTIHAFNNNKEG
jgi:hypothetical protein